MIAVLPGLSKQLSHSLLRKPESIGVKDALHLYFPTSAFIHQNGRLHASHHHIGSHCRTEVLLWSLHHLFLLVAIHSHRHTSNTRQADAIPRPSPPQPANRSTILYCFFGILYIILYLIQLHFYFFNGRNCFFLYWLSTISQCPVLLLPTNRMRFMSRRT